MLASQFGGILRQLFGDNRAEWPPERFGDLFIKPAYFARLETKRPCFLFGGRGTGKTTALRSLRYDATLERIQKDGLTFDDQEYVGVYLRVNKSRVAAFRGPGLSPDDWQKAFAHYFNLLISLELCRATLWLEEQSGVPLGPGGLMAICRDLALPEVRDSHELMASIQNELSRLQLFVNNPQSAERPIFSLSDVPLKTFASTLQEGGLLGPRIVFCCIDEYENLLDEQQALLNTYIKHAEPPFSYKIGARHKGLRTHQTTDANDMLRVPDDFAAVSIADEGFELFATAVANLRLHRARSQGVPVPASLSDFLQALSTEEEAHELGANAVAEKVRAQLQAAGDPDVRAWCDRHTEFDLHFLKYWQEHDEGKIALLELAKDWMTDPDSWKTRQNNYGYVSLFWLSKGRKGARIRKFYSGERTILALASGNIRYFLELLDESIAVQIAAGGYTGSDFVLSARSQTQAAKIVGKRRLDQLEGLADRGVELKRLVLAIGKVFFELARNPEGKTPEVSSFVLSGAAQARLQAEQLLQDGISHLAFEATPRTKATTNLEMKDDEYRLHPIFCAFFEFSHRRKRRTTFGAEHLLEVSQKPAEAISRLLNGTTQSTEDELPEQLAFFSSFYQAT